MAPEQVRASDVDSRADIFSFGALLYELLTGACAFKGDTAADVMTAVLSSDPPALPLTIPLAVRNMVHRCLEKGRDERFQSARDLGFALRQSAAAIGAHAGRYESAHRLQAPSPAAIREQLVEAARKSVNRRRGAVVGPAAVRRRRDTERDGRLS